MREYIICDSCTGTILIDSMSCDYCGSQVDTEGPNYELLKLKDEIEKKIYSSDLSELISKIEASKFKNHPVILFRKAKALLIDYMTNDGVLEADEFCYVIKIIDEISAISEDYWIEFVLYLTVLFPTAHTKLFVDDFIKIRNYLKSINKDLDGVVENKMIQQILITEAGATFYKEYLFYIDEKNFINNKDFVQKRDFLIAKYDKFSNHIKSII